MLEILGFRTLALSFYEPCFELASRGIIYAIATSATEVFTKDHGLGLTNFLKFELDNHSQVYIAWVLP